MVHKGMACIGLVTAFALGSLVTGILFYFVYPQLQKMQHPSTGEVLVDVGAIN